MKERKDEVHKTNKQKNAHAIVLFAEIHFFKKHFQRHFHFLNFKLQPHKNAYFEYTTKHKCFCGSNKLKLFFLKQYSCSF